MPEKSRLVEFNEYCLSAGESALTMLITLYNELRSGEHHRKTKALSSPAADGRQNKRVAYMHFKSMSADRTRNGGNISLDLLWLLSVLSKREANETKHVKCNEQNSSRLSLHVMNCHHDLCHEY